MTIQRSVKLIAGTGVTCVPVDNTSTGQQEWTVTNTSPGTVGALTPTSVSGTGWWYSSSGTLLSIAVEPGGDVSPGTESLGVLPLILNTVNSNVGVFGDATHVAAVTATAKGLITAISNVAITFPVTNIFGGSGINVTGGPAFTVTLGIPVASANGGTGVVSPTAHATAVAEGASPFNFVSPSATAGGLYVSNGSSADPSFATAAGDISAGTPSGGTIPFTVNRVKGIPVSAQTQMVGRVVIQTDLSMLSSNSFSVWAHCVVASTTFNSTVQFLSDGATWTTSVSGVASVVSVPNTPAVAPVFEITGTQAGDQVIVRLETLDPGGHQDEGITLAYAFASSAPTWPGGYTFPFTFSALRGTSTGSAYNQVSAPLYINSAPSGANLFIQPAVVNTITSASSETTTLAGNAALVVEIWR